VVPTTVETSRDAARAASAPLLNESPFQPRAAASGLVMLLRVIVCHSLLLAADVKEAESQVVKQLL
jgi:hypothetical protein